MAVEERKSNGFLKLEDSPSNGLIKYRRQKRARPGSDAFRGLIDPSEAVPYTGRGLWNVFHDALSLGHSQLPHKLMMIYFIRDNEQLKDRYLGDSEIWDKVQNIGQGMIILASGLSSLSRASCQKQTVEDLVNAADEPKPEVTCQIGLVKNSAGSYPTSQSDCSTKPDQTEASDVYKACTCKQCGTEANGEGSLICDGCEAMYHFSCIKPAIKEIPTRSWYCAACSTNNKDFADAAFTEVNKGSLHQNCVVCDRLEVSETLEDLDENDSRIRVAADSGESSVSSMESEETPELSRTAMSCLCKICGTSEGEEKKFLICGHIHCPYRFYHIRCLKSSQIASPQQQNQPCWYCPSCLCRACFCDKDDDKIVLCDGCDEAYHTYCMKPPRTSVPRGQWYCVPCNIARAREGMKRYEQWILQQHRKNEGRQSNEVGGSMDLLLSAAEKLSSEEKLASRR
ncbi:PHD-finger [Musa troglodytarum]|uniref:PHD-finger n=1 Tax=Musa troglodytarum TaxID=320322 RepID=A0A9E7JIM6_9LILI|nr:PHD-finger [Musa troglodytarum]